jgi:hypothetical protein
MFAGFSRERTIRRTLRRLARQRVAIVLQPGNCWVIENAVEDNAKTDAALKTCLMRGWVEPMERAVPMGQFIPSGGLPPKLDGVGTLYKLTSTGWSVVHRARQLALLAIVISVLSVLVSISSLFLNTLRHQP